MKKLMLLFSVLIPSTMWAWWGNGQTKELGRFVETGAVTVSTSAVTALYTQSFENVTTDIFNNGSYAVYIGSNTSTLYTTGFPILPNSTYTIDGQHTGIVYALGAAGGSDVNVRVIRYKTGAQ